MASLWNYFFSTFFIVVFFFLGYWFFIKQDTRQLRPILYSALIFIAGYCWGEMNIYYHLQHKLPAQIENQVIHVEGRIVSVPSNLDNDTQFQFQIDSVGVEKEASNSWTGKALLSWYQPRWKQSMLPTLIPGQKWCFIVKLKNPRGYSNPGSFDYESWLFEQGVMAKGYVIEAKKPKKNRLLESPKWHSSIEQLRQKIMQTWEERMSLPFLGILLALTIGLTNHITTEQWQVFTNTGTIHLISISGFHIGLMAGVAFGCVSFVWRRIFWICERFPAQKAGAIAAIIMAVGYSVLAGFSVPTERSMIMVLVFMGSLLFQRKTDVWACFLWSLFFVVLWDPFAPLNMSFWLSFGAVAMILYVMIDHSGSLEESQEKGIYVRLSRYKKSISHGLKLQGSIFLGLVPLSLFWFSQVSVSSLWANIIAIPVTGCFILPLALVAILLTGICFPLALFLMKISYWFFSLLYVFLHWISLVHPVILVGSVDHVWQLFFGTMGTLILLAPKGCSGRWIGFVFWLPLLFPLNTPIHLGEAKMSLLDVGQGLAAVVQTKNHVLVFDTGPKLGENFDTGKAVVLPYLRHQHIHHIDALVISHADMDHRGGMASVLKGIVVKSTFVNDLKIVPKNTFVLAKLCEPNLSWTWDGVTFQFLTKGLAQFTNTNDRSCVLKISNGDQSVLFPGDLEAQGEHMLIKNYGEILKSDLLVAGHHGSKTSSSLPWINAVNPNYVLFPTGYLNRYHFPNNEIVARYKHQGAIMLSTADCGLIDWTMGHDFMKMPQCYRKENARFWY